MNQLWYLQYNSSNAVFVELLQDYHDLKHQHCIFIKLMQNRVQNSKCGVFTQ